MLGKISEGSSQSRSFSWKPMITIEDKGKLGKEKGAKVERNLEFWKGIDIV